MIRMLWRAVLGAGLVVGGLLGGVPGAFAQQTAASYFHEAAQQYVAGNRAAAQRAVEQGLAVAPSDPRLQALRNKLQEQGRPQGEQDDDASSSAGEQAGQNTEASSEEASGDEESSSRSDDGSPQTGPRNESTAESSQAGQPDTSPSPTDSSAQMDPGRRGPGSPADTLSREQAERLLRALEGQERQLLRRLQTRSARSQSVEKDW